MAERKTEPKTKPDERQYFPPGVLMKLAGGGLVTLPTADGSPVKLSPSHVVMLRDVDGTTTAILLSTGTEVPVAMGIDAVADALYPEPD
jgi:hypothetical protein